MVSVGGKRPACAGVSLSFAAINGNNGKRKLEYESITKCAVESNPIVNLSLLFILVFIISTARGTDYPSFSSQPLNLLIRV
jgi:hypothetical protein